MRFAIISDIHSNLPALTTAISIIESSHIDQTVCLGDIVGYGAMPNECISIIKERKIVSVLGNHDLAATDIREAKYFNTNGRIAAEWTNKVLTKENAQFLASLPYKYIIDPFTLVHANPAKPEQWGYIMSVEDAGLQFPFFDTKICFIGHSHIPTVCGEDLQTFSFEWNKRFLINVGSIGQPRDGNPKLSFGILDTNKKTLEIIRAEYDVKSAAESIREARLPNFLADRLFKGI